MDVALQRILIGRSARSQLVTGLRGVGKTVLLQEFARVAAKRGFIHEHVEATRPSSFPLQVALALRKALFKLGGKKKVKGVNRRALGRAQGVRPHPAGRRRPSCATSRPSREWPTRATWAATWRRCSRRWAGPPRPTRPASSSPSTTCTVCRTPTLEALLVGPARGQPARACRSRWPGPACPSLPAVSGEARPTPSGSSGSARSGRSAPTKRADAVCRCRPPPKG